MERTAARRVPVRAGYFPDTLQQNEAFDVIVVNDVIDHIPKIGDALSACVARLNPEGLLVLNLPTSMGLSTNCRACWLALVGVVRLRGYGRKICHLAMFTTSTGRTSRTYYQSMAFHRCVTPNYLRTDQRSSRAFALR